MIATVLREEQGKALIAEFCSQSLSLYLPEGTVEAEDRDRDVGCFGGLHSGDEDMDCINAGKFLYAGHAKFPQPKLSFSSRNSHPDTAIERIFPEMKKKELSLNCMV